MPATFESVHRDQILGSLTTVDRLIVHGHLRSFWKKGGGGLASFLFRQGVPVGKAFGGYVHAASEKVRLRASEIAQKSGRPFIYQDRVVRGKDELAREIAQKDGISRGLICVFSTLELATCFALVHGGSGPLERGPVRTGGQAAKGDVRDELQEAFGDAEEVADEHGKTSIRAAFQDRRSRRQPGICAAWE